MKDYRITFGIECFFEDSFYTVCNGCQFTKGKEKLLKLLENQYEICKDWIGKNLEE